MLVEFAKQRANPALSQRPLGACQHPRLVTLDIDLDQIDAADL
jgi:hypothetical protein